MKKLGLPKFGGPNYYAYLCRNKPEQRINMLKQKIMVVVSVLMGSLNHKVSDTLCVLIYSNIILFFTVPSF